MEQKDINVSLQKMLVTGSALQKMLVTVSPLPSFTHATSTDGHRSLVVCLYILALSASCSPPIPLLIYVLMLANHLLYFVHVQLQQGMWLEG